MPLDLLIPRMQRLISSYV